MNKILAHVILNYFSFHFIQIWKASQHFWNSGCKNVMLTRLFDCFPIALILWISHTMKRSHDLHQKTHTKNIKSRPVRLLWIIILSYSSSPTISASISHHLRCRFAHDVHYIERAVSSMGDSDGALCGLGLHFLRTTHLMALWTRDAQREHTLCTLCGNIHRKSYLYMFCETAINFTVFKQTTSAYNS